MVQDLTSPAHNHTQCSPAEQRSQSINQSHIRLTAILHANLRAPLERTSAIRDENGQMDV